MSRVVARTSQYLIDALVLSAALWLAFLLRFDWVLPAQMLKRVAFLWPYAVAFQMSVLIGLGVTRYAWRYVGLREAIRILLALSVASAVLLVVRLLLPAFASPAGRAQFAMLPVGVILLDLMLSFLGVSAVRIARRLLGERTERRNNGAVATTTPGGTRTVLIGAGQAGVLVAREIAKWPALGIVPVGYIDDDSLKHGAVIHGIPVLGGTDRISELCEMHRVEEAIITIASAPGKEVRRITRLCEEAGVSVKIIPGLYEIVGGQVGLSRIRKIAIEDLLRRSPAALDEPAIEDALHDNVILVTGAGGSIGSELCRQIARFRPRAVVLFERSENALFEVHRELASEHPTIDFIPVLGDVGDTARVDEVFLTNRPRLVFHAAAHKHVPMVELNRTEAIRNNVFGTKCVADAAHRHGCLSFVQVSTNKAVNPTSVMGLTKRLAEIYIQSLDGRSETRFVTVRFGNVLGSSGSVVPIFQEQIAHGGPVTVTHPDMRRYFMTIPEATQLILQAAIMGHGGEIFILDMGQPVRIVDLAHDLIRLSGLRPNEDIEVVFTGVRPGEKLFEELSTDEESAEKTRHPQVFVGRCRTVEFQQIERALRALEQPGPVSQHELKRALIEIVPEYAPTGVEAAPTSALPHQGQAVVA